MARSETIYARVDAEDKQWLRERVAKEKGNWSENAVISQLLKHFKALPEKAQQDIMAGQGALTSAGVLMGRVSWLQHAFGQKFWAWSLDECYELASVSELVQDAYEIWRFAQYRAAFCWLEIAIQLRREAIRLRSSESWNNLYEAAEWAVCASIVHNRRHSAGKPQEKDVFNKQSSHPLIAYNLACGMSLRAQYCIERSLGPEATYFEGPSKEFQEQDRKKTEEQLKEWDKIPEDWREQLSAKLKERFEEFASKVSATASEAMKELAQLTTAENLDASPRDTGFMVRYAPHDPDLAFLRFDKAFKKSFTDWQPVDGAEPVLLRAFANAQKNVPNDVRTLIVEWAAANRLR